VLPPRHDGQTKTRRLAVSQRHAEQPHDEHQTSEEKRAGVYTTEKVDRKTGWQFVCLVEEWTRGYLQGNPGLHGMRRDWAGSARRSRPGAGDDQANYAGYWAAEEGRRVVL
jgi:hypothetical protein